MTRKHVHDPRPYIRDAAAFDEPPSGGLPRFGAITASYAELLWIVPCLAVAYVMTLLFDGSARLFKSVSARLGSGAPGVVGPPVIAGVAAGYGLAALTGAGPMLMVTVTTTAHLAGVTRKPLLVLAVLFLCFPVEGVLWMGLAAIIGAALPVPRVLLAANAERE